MNAHSMPTAAQRPGGDVSSAEGVAADELKQFIERLEQLEEEKAGIMGDIKEVFAELKGRGFDAKAVRTILRIRKQDHSERQEQEAVSLSNSTCRPSAWRRRRIARRGSSPQFSGPGSRRSRSAWLGGGRLGGIGQAEGSARIPAASK